MAKISPIWQNTAVSSVATGLQGMANLVTVIYLARTLAPVHYGIFSYTWAVSGMVGILTYLGIKPLLTRELSRSGSPAQVVGYGLSLTALVSLLVAAGLVALSFAIPGLVNYRGLFSIWALFVFFNGATPRWVYSGIQRLWMVSVGDLGGRAGPALLDRALGPRPARSRPRGGNHRVVDRAPCRQRSALAAADPLPLPARVAAGGVKDRSRGPTAGHQFIRQHLIFRGGYLDLARLRGIPGRWLLRRRLSARRLS